MREHLTALRERLPSALKGQALRISRHTDYPYRFIISRDAWKTLATMLAEEINYNNFKGECADVGGNEDYVHALHEVWEVMRELQRKENLEESPTPPKPKPSPKKGKQLRLPPTKP